MLYMKAFCTFLRYTSIIIIEKVCEFVKLYNGFMRNFFSIFLLGAGIQFSENVAYKALNLLGA